METGRCPETSRDANGYNRYYRIKVLPNAAGKALRHAVSKLNK